MIDRLLALPKFGAGVGLHRMAWMLDRVGAPFDAIKITGSNGKGSVAAYTDAILRALGVRTGLYTSPHLRRFNERIKVGGVDICDDALADAIDWFEAAHAEWPHPDDTFGAFEAFTAVALTHFAGVGVSTVVLEAGIGGRYDSTRVVPGSVCALTSIDLEHTAILGATAELIAYDKADICPPGGTLVVGDLDPELVRRLRVYTGLRGVHLRTLDEAPVTMLHEGADGSDVTLTLGGATFDVHTPLVGRHQIDNARIAALLVDTWAAGRAGVADAVRDGLAATRWPGRCERISEHPEVYIDVGHTPAAAATFRDALERLGRPIRLVLGVSQNKDAAGIVRALAPGATEVICTRAHHNGLAPEAIEALVAAAAPFVPRRRAATIDDAMALATRHADGAVVAVGGGLFLAVEADAVLRGEDPRALRFF